MRSHRNRTLSMFLLFTALLPPLLFGMMCSTVASTRKLTALIVGAGPVGYSTALALDSLGTFSEITVVEKRPETSFESTKAYLYLLDKRGQQITDLLNMTSIIAQRSVTSLESAGLNECLPTGEIRNKNLVMEKPDESKIKYWIPRSELLNCFQEVIKQKQQDRGSDCKIRVMYESSCDGFYIPSESPFDEKVADATNAASAASANGVASVPSSDPHRLHVRITTTSSSASASTPSAVHFTSEMSPDLVVGADGLNSEVRKWLESRARDEAQMKVQPPHGQERAQEGSGQGSSPSPTRFTPVCLDSDAAGLRYKMITLKNRFPLPVHPSVQPSPGTVSSPAAQNQPAALPPQLSIPEEKYVFRSVSQKQEERVNLGLLSVKGDAKRTANIICVPQHKIWSLTTFEEVKKFLTASFPQVDFSSFVEDEELRRFAEAQPGVFPQPQYVPSMAWVLPVPSVLAESDRTSERTSGGMSDGSKGAAAGAVQGLVLAGDSAHAFPPDLGQGVNSGLSDVYALYTSLRDHPPTDHNLTQALTVYEQQRVPEAIAICKLMQFGYPYQYNQAPIKAKFAQLNLAFRLVLNKLLPFLFSPPAVLMVVSQPELTYDQILKKAHATTRNIFLTFTALVLSLLIKHFRLI